MRALRILLAGVVCLVAGPAMSSTARAAQVDIELFAPARDASRAIQSALRAKAAELAPGDLQLADLYYTDASTALHPPSGPPDEAKAAHLFRMAAAAAKVAETRSIEIVREREAAGAGNQYLDALEPDPFRILPPRPPMGMAAAEYSRRQREASNARAARRAAEAALEQLRSTAR